MPERNREVYPILLAGGSGTRLWPVSRALYPKQLVSFIGGDSLVQSTIKRLTPVVDSDKIRVVCGQEHFHEISRHMDEIGLPADGKIICEPCGRNTAPAILLAALTIRKSLEDAVVCVFPADHVIRDIRGFQEKLKSAIRIADKGRIVTFGIQPHYPETGYGYIEGGSEKVDDAPVIKRFVEKPDMDTAKAYIAAGNFFWNSGMFVFRLSVILEEFRVSAPELLWKMTALVDSGRSITRSDYEMLPNISIDVAIMEKTRKGVVLPSDFGWSDIGSWKSLYDFLPKDENRNVIDGDVIAENSRNCIIMGYERLIATNRIENMVVVETPDSVFVSDIDGSQDVKSIVEKLKKKGRREYHKHRTEYHPWGTITLLDETDGCSVCRLVLHPARMTRIEADEGTMIQLTATRGLAKILCEDSSRLLMTGNAFLISENTAATVENVGQSALFIVQITCRIGADAG